MTSKPKLLILASTFPRWNNDTLPIFVYELALNLLSDFEVHVLAPHFKGAKLHEDMDGIQVHRFFYALPRWEILTYGGGGLNNLKKNHLTYLLVPMYMVMNLFAFLRLAFKYKFAVVNVHWIIPSGFLVALCKWMFNFKLVITSHGGDIYGFSKNKLMSFPTKLAMSFALRRADAITSVSGAIKDAFLTKFEVPGLSDKFNVIPLGIYLNRFPSKVRTLQTNANIVLLSVGRLAEKKGITYLISAVKLLKDKGMNVILNLVGAGPEQADLEAQVEELGIRNQVNFVGFVQNKDLGQYFDNSHIMIVPSVIAKNGDSEGSPTTIKESLASGIPVIVSNIPGSDEIITDGENGLIVEQRNSEAIAAAVMQLVSDPQKYTEMSQRALTSAQQFSWEVARAKFTNLFNGLLSNAK